MTTKGSNSPGLKTVHPQPRNPDLQFVEYESALNRLVGDKELLAEFIEIVLCDSPKLMDDICSAVEQNDCQKLERSAHALKGMMINFGAKECCALALDFELAGREDKTEAVKDSLPKLKDLYRQLCDELNSL